MLATTEMIWEDFHDRLYQFIRRRVADEQHAEDILQDVFLKVHTHVETLRNDDSLVAWLYQLTRNRIIDYYRTGQIVSEKVPDLPYELESSLENVELELAPAIRMMIECLPPIYREALILTEYQGLTQRELAELLNLSLPGAKSRVQRAREKLKAMLLDCCHFEFDRLGRVIDYQPHCACGAETEVACSDCC